MKVLLTQDVADLGLAGEIHSVAGGYARNYLMPRGLVVLATKGALKQAEDIRQTGMRRRARERANADAQAEIIAKQKLLFEARAGENNRLYGSVTPADVAEALSKAVEFEVDRRRIQMEPLRDLGLYDVEIRLMADVAPKFKVAVVREGESWADAEARAAKPVEKSDAEEAAENDFE
jgi:large subunit ribosomal protein L9